MCVLPVLPLDSVVFIVLKRCQVYLVSGSVEPWLLGGVMAEHGNFTFCSHFCSSGQSPWGDRGTRVATALKTSTIPANDHLPADVPPTRTHAEFYLLPCSCRIKPVIPHTPGCWQIGSRLADSANMINICFLKMMCAHPACVTEIEHSLWVFRWTE